MKSFLSHIPGLSRRLSSCGGVGPKRAAALNIKGLTVLGDILDFLPLRYEDRRLITPIRDALPGRPCLVTGRVIRAVEKRLNSSRRLYSIIIEDDTGAMELVWFNYNRMAMAKLSNPDVLLSSFGSVVLKGKNLQMVHPDVKIIDGEVRLTGINPVYSIVAGVPPRLIVKLVSEALDTINEYAGEDPLPAEFRQTLPSLQETYNALHKPSDEIVLSDYLTINTDYHRRLLYDSVLSVMLSLLYRKKIRDRKEAVSMDYGPDFLDELAASFPFKLTNGQLDAIYNVLEDLKSRHPMSRLIQGDVGCGKTAVAVAASAVVARNGDQTVFMVPTKILAKQHIEYFLSMPGSLGLKPVLVTGEYSRDEKEKVKYGIKTGLYNVIIGTHALIYSDLFSKNPVLNIVDEQHRFGVRQRTMLDSGGYSSHQLVMTATPIPRTLAMTLYADMDISFIKEIPDNRQPVKTFLKGPKDKKHVFDLMMERLKSGDQVFVVCPFIDSVDDIKGKNVVWMYKQLSNLLSPNFNVGFLHSRLQNTAEKDRQISDFLCGKTRVLVCTTMIEVGLHVPNATMIIVEQADRFGLAQLHQLRGRVGRGTKPGLCIFMHDDNLSSESVERLKTIASVSDGFILAEKDMALRGYGFLTGYRQSGISESDIYSISADPEILFYAKKTAELILEKDPLLSMPEHALLRERYLIASEKPIEF